MCGIAGYFQVSASGQPCNPEQLKQATATLHHRGPDDNGIWTGQDRQAGLGHTRLSILDLSRHGHQPMFSEDGRFVLVFNGEIYNYREIHKELRGKGFEFDSDCDTEELLKAFQVWGTDCVQRFIGMFAFAIWDKRQKKLLLCRDRVGVKPLYYGWDGRVVCFASELKALLEFKHWQPEINRQALGEFLQYGYIAAPRSTYQQVNKLLPGHWLEISTTAPHPRLSRYWSLQDGVAKGPMEVNAEEDLADELEALLVDAFKYRMIADVPVGVFLSGGIDSSIVAALLQKHSDRVIHTFTIGFDDKSHDESAWARKIADHLGTRHTEHILDLDKAREIIPRLPEIYDEPFGDSSGIPTAMVSTLARQEVTVALSANGGDELFGGYNSYVLNPARLHAIASQPLWLRKFAGMGLAALPDSILSKDVGATAAFGSALPSKLLRKLIKLRHVLPKATPSSVYQASQAHFMPAEIKRLIGGYEDPRRPAEAYSGAFAEQMTQWDFEYGKADAFMVLGKVFEDKLRKFAIEVPVHRMTTLARGKGCSPREIENRAEKTGQEIRCLFMSRLVPGKGLDEAIDIYLGIKARFPKRKVRLTIAGDGPEMERLENMLNRQRISNVNLTGYVTGRDKYQVFTAHHLLLFPSSYGEGLPNVVLEAMLYGLVVAATPVGGIPDVVKHGRNGILFRLQDRKNATRQLGRILENSAQVAHMGILNHETALNRFTPAVVAQRFMSIMDSLVME